MKRNELSKHLSVNVGFNYFRNELDELQNYIQELERWRINSLKSLQEKANADRKKFDDEDIEYFAVAYLEELIRLGESFPRHIRNSAFITIYSCAEDFLISLCETMQRHVNAKIELSDLKHKGIASAKIYLEKVVSIEYTNNKPDWNVLTKYNKIRNQIVHNYGRSDSNEFLDLIKQIEGISVDKKRNILIEDIFLHNAINFLRSFSKDLNNRISEWIERDKYK